MKRRLTGFSLAILMLAVVVLCSGCLNKAKIKALYGSGDASTPEAEAAAAAAANTYMLQGSVTAIPLMQAISDALAADHPFDFVGVGKDEAVAAVQNGEADAAVYDGSLEELSDAANAVVVATEGICVIVNESFPADDISIDQLVAIFTDQDNLLADQPVNIVIANPDGLSRKTFEDIFPIKGDVDGTPQSLVPDVATIVNSDAEVVSAVAADPSAIGIVSSAAALDGVKALRIDGVAPGEEGYAGSRSLVFLCKDKENATTKAILEFFTGSTATDILSGNGYVPVK